MNVTESAFLLNPDEQAKSAFLLNLEKQANCLVRFQYQYPKSWLTILAVGIIGAMAAAFCISVAAVGGLDKFIHAVSEMPLNAKLIAVGGACFLLTLTICIYVKHAIFLSKIEPIKPIITESNLPKDETVTNNNPPIDANVNKKEDYGHDGHFFDNTSEESNDKDSLDETSEEISSDSE